MEDVDGDIRRLTIRKEYFILKLRQKEERNNKNGRGNQRNDERIRRKARRSEEVSFPRNQQARSYYGLGVGFYHQQDPSNQRFE